MTEETTDKTEEQGTAQPTPPSAESTPQTEAAPEAPALEQQLLQMKDMLLRKAAEFENYKKRVDQESSAVFRMANEGLVRAVLPIVDDMERSLKAAKDRSENESFFRGLELIYQKLLKVLESQGVKPLEPMKEFSVEYHDALMQVPREDVPPFTILEEVERGYTMYGKVIRHAKVVVSSAPIAQAESSAVDGDEASTGKS